MDAQLPACTSGEEKPQVPLAEEAGIWRDTESTPGFCLGTRSCCTWPHFEVGSCAMFLGLFPSLLSGSAAGCGPEATTRVQKERTVVHIVSTAG